MTAITIARPMPGMAPRTATPTKQTIESQNSQRWIRKIRTRSVTSIKPIAEAMTTAAKRGGGQMLEQVRGDQQQQSNGERADDAGQLRAGACGLRHRRA